MQLTKRTSSILFVVLIIVVLVFVVFTVYYMISNKQAFTENPFIFGAKKMNLGDCNCVCSNGGFTQQQYLYFNQTSFGSQGG